MNTSYKSLVVISAVALGLMSAPALSYGANPSGVSFPGVPNIPLDSKISFNGFFRKHQPVKIVWGIGQPGAQTTESLWNAALVIKYLQAHHYRYKIHVVLYSKAVLLGDMFNAHFNTWGPLLRKLSKEGVTFTVCHNAMYLFHVHTKDLYPFMHPIPAGILSIVEYEMRGYSPIFNPNSVTPTYKHPVG